MSKVEINIFEFLGRPFQDGLNVVLYEPDQPIRKEQLHLVGKAVAQVELDAKAPSVATQLYSTVCCAPVNLAHLKNNILVSDGQREASWTRVETRKVHPTEVDGNEILRRLVSKAISNQQIARGWFVEAYRQVYYWSFNLTEQLSMGFMDVYPGFVFVPYVYENGSCAVLIDPKFRFVPRRNYRDIVDDLQAQGKTVDEIASTLEGEMVIDACPIINCMLRKNPLSSCRLKGAGRRRFLKKLDYSKRPSDANYRDLIEYHGRKEICPNSGLLGKSLKNLPPIALVEARNLDRPLEFPLERLRKELKLHELDKFGRLLVMKYIRPSMKERWYLTKGFMAYVDDVRIGTNPPLRVLRRFAEAKMIEKPWAHSETFSESKLRFAKYKNGSEPYIGLEAYGPFDIDDKPKRWFNELHITIYNFSSLNDDKIKGFYRDLVEGFSYRPTFVGLRRLFKLSVPSFTDDVIQKSISGSSARLRRQPHIAIIVTQLTGEKNVRQYEPYKRELTREGVPCQFVLDRNVGPNVSTSKYSGYLKNIALSVYAKIGGIPWTLDRPVGGRTKCYVGLASIIRKESVFFSVQAFDHYGRWLGGWTEQSDRASYPKVLKERLKDAWKNFASIHGPPSQIILHKDGEVWTDLEMPSIEQSLGSESKIVSIKKLGVSRVYDVASADYLTKRGSYVQTSSNEAFLVTSGPPHSFQGSQKPLTIEIKKPNPNSDLIRETCNEVFQLSLVYGGYMLAITSKPVTTHFASTAVTIAAKYNIEENPKLWKKAWFL